MTRSKVFVNEGSFPVKFLLVIGTDPSVNPWSQHVEQLELDPGKSVTYDFTGMHADLGMIFLLRGSQVKVKLILLGDDHPQRKDIDDAQEIAAVENQSAQWSLVWRTAGVRSL